MTDTPHPIQMVSRLTGLSMHVIRIWEHRYNAVEPMRTSTNRRVYSRAHIERLILLREATQAGYKISQVARLPTAKLRELAAASSADHGRIPQAVAGAPQAVEFLTECVEAIKQFDALLLNDILKRAAASLGAMGLLQKLIAPLTRDLGEMWRGGEITSAHEHFATAVIRVVLGEAAKPFGLPDHAPVLIVATPVGQVHELGALLVAATSVNFGWRVTYLGASLPAAEIAGAAQLTGARAVALSLVYPGDDPQMAGELWRLREALPPQTALLAGGRAVASYHETLDEIGALQIEGLAQMGETLDQLRKPLKTFPARRIR